MSEQVVNYIIENEIAVLTINNPPMNPLIVAVREQLSAIMSELAGRLDDVKAVILTGTGKALVAGAGLMGGGSPRSVRRRGMR